jgi:hypothetical protein
MFGISKDGMRWILASFFFCLLFFRIFSTRRLLKLTSRLTISFKTFTVLLQLLRLQDQWLHINIVLGIEIDYTLYSCTQLN